jgi:hypothetical protein
MKDVENRIELWLHAIGDKTMLRVVIEAGDLDEKSQIKKIEIEGRMYYVLAQKFHRQMVQSNLFHQPINPQP